MEKKQNILIISPQLPTNPNGGAVVINERLKILSIYFNNFLIARDKKADKNYSVSYIKKSFVIKKHKFYNIPFIIYDYFIKTVLIIYYLIFKYKINTIQLEFYNNLIYLPFIYPIKLIKKIKIFYTAHDVQCLYYNRSSFKFRFIRLIEKISFKLLIDKVFVWGDEDKNEIISWKIDNNKIIMIPPIIKSPEKSWRCNKNFNFLFLGSWNHKPNRDSLNYILKNIWPDVSRLSPHSILFLILGKKDNDFKTNLKNVVNLGYVENVYEIMNKCNFLLAPIISGTGIKMKIAESFSFGIPVLTTSLGLRNFSNVNKNIVMIGDNKEEQLLIIKKTLSKKIDLNKVSSYERDYSDKNFSEKNIELYRKYYG